MKTNITEEALREQTIKNLKAVKYLAKTIIELSEYKSNWVSKDTGFMLERAFEESKRLINDLADYLDSIEAIDEDEDEWAMKVIEDANKIEL